MVTMLGWVAALLISLLSVQFCFVCLLASDVVKWTRCFWKDGDRTVVGPGGHNPEVTGNLSTVGGGRAGMDTGLVCLVLSQTVYLRKAEREC